MDRDPLTEALDRVRRFLVEEWDLPPELVDVYVMALERGRITARQIRDATPNANPGQAETLLTRLCKGRYLYPSPERGRPGRPGGRGRGKVYAPVPPHQVLQHTLSAANRLRPYLGQIAEHLENLPPPKPEEASDIWVLEHSQLVPMFEALAAGTQDSITIRGRDLDWLGDVVESLAAAHRRGVKVTILATSPPKDVIRLARPHGLRVQRSRIGGPPIAVFDGRTVIEAYKASTVGSSYKGLLKHLPYLAKRLDEQVRAEKEAK